MRVSEVVTLNEINSWNDGDIVTIKAGTGMGKSYFIKNNLYAIAKRDNKKILMLIHRRNCTDQFFRELARDDKLDIITIRTYQRIEYDKKRGNDFSFNEYDYIICDEFHYFMSDAAFNKTTDMSLEAILKQTNKIRIFMSATGDYMEQYINNFKKLETINYSLPIEFNFIKQLTFYNKYSTLETFIDEAIQKGNKGIFFIESAKKAYELHKKYKEHTLFNCSKTNAEYYKYVDQDRISDMLENEKFEELILITTTCMDAGVNIIDDKLEHIVCDVKDISTLIQCIGRKRIVNKKDKIYLYIKTITNQQLGGIQTQLGRKLEMARFLKDNTVEAYIEKYQRENDYFNIVYDDVVGEEDKGTKKINWLIYFKCITQSNEIEVMKRYGNFCYCKSLARKFGFHDQFDGYTYRLLEEESNDDRLRKYLDSIVGNKLYKKEQKELKETFKSNGLNARTLGINTLNGNIKDRELPYILEIGKRKSYSDENGKIKKEQSYWVLGKVNYTV